MSELIIEIHIPLVPAVGIADDAYPYPWIEDVEEFLSDFEGPGEQYDGGEEWTNHDGESEYLFFVSDATELELLTIARAVAQLQGVPTGVYATANDPDGEMGEGRRLDVDL